MGNIQTKAAETFKSNERKKRSVGTQHRRQNDRQINRAFGKDTEGHRAMKKNHDIITVDVTLAHQTEKAYLVDAGTKAGKVWVPKSQCEYEEGELQISEQLATDKGLI